MTQTATRLRAEWRGERRRRRFARLWTGMDEAVDEQVSQAKDELLRDLPTDLVEIGPGLGSAFPYYRSGTSVVAFEPNQWFHDRLVATATEYGIDLDLRGEAFGPGSLDAEEHDSVVSCLTLCSVGDIAGALTEIDRALRPGGRFVFIEHVAATSGPQAVYQKAVRAPWRVLADGCDPRSRFLGHLAESPLEVETMKLERLGSNLDPTNLVAWGTARKT